MYYLHNFSPISDLQFGFLDNKNTVQALNFIVKKLYYFKSLYKYSAVIAADISAAFDSIRFSDINDALRTKGVNKSLASLIMSFITDRILVFYHPNCVTYINVVRGVPQGSSIGPILWNLVLDTLLKIPLPLNSSISAYADDISIIVAANTRKKLETVGNSILNKLFIWSSSKCLTISLEKTNVIFMFNTAKLKRSPYFYINNKHVKSVKSLRILGLVFDPYLTWVQHAHYLRNSLHGLAQSMFSVSRINWGVKFGTFQ